MSNTKHTLNLTRFSRGVGTTWAGDVGDLRGAPKCPAWCPKWACTATSAMPPGGPSTASATTAAGLALHACAAMGMKVSLMRSLEEACEEMMFLQPSTIIHPKIKVPSCWFIASSGITKPVFPPPNQWIWMDMAWLAQGMGIEPLASFPPGYRPQSHRAHPTFGSPCWTGPD